MSAVGPLRGESNDFFDFVIGILHRCEEQKCWKTLQATCAYACGYTASGAAILIDIFLGKNIFNIDDLKGYITDVAQSMDIDYTEDIFIFQLNETIGNLLNIADVYCSGTENKRGIDGEIARELMSSASSETVKDESEMTVYKINGGCSNLKEGANIVSFIHRDICTLPAHETVAAIEQGQTGTFHHATLWINREMDKCVIIDSWAELNEEDKFPACRPLEYEILSLQEIIHALDRINAVDATLDETFAIFQRYFQPVLPGQFLKQLQDKGPVLAITVNPLYITHIGDRIFENMVAKIKAGVPLTEMTELGGKPRKKNRKLRKKTRKLRKRSKRYSKAVRKYKK